MSTKRISLGGTPYVLSEDCKDVTMTNPSLVRVTPLQERNYDQ